MTWSTLRFAAASALFVLGCAKNVPESFATDAGSGGAAGGGTGGGAGGASDTDAGTPADASGDAYVAPACDPAASTMGVVTNTSPLVSVGAHVTTSTGVTNPANLVDGKYHTTAASTFPAPSDQSPAWAAIAVRPGPTRLLLEWADSGYTDYNSLSGGAPGAYRIETSADSTDGADGTWETVATEPANPVRNREHAFPFAGKSWVRFVVTAPAAGATNVQIDEIALYDISSSGSDRPSDSWFFMGDSITAAAFRRNLGMPFDAVIHAAFPPQQPIFVSGGIGGELSAMGLAHVDQWLALNPDIQHFAILYGTNDSWDKDGAQAQSAAQTMQTNLDMIVQKLLAAGRVPILARIPYASMHHTDLPPFNAAIDGISTAHGLPCGPDFYNYFLANPTQLGPDGVHPADLGSVAMNRLWAEAVERLYTLK